MTLIFSSRLPFGCLVTHIWANDSQLISRALLSTLNINNFISKKRIVSQKSRNSSFFGGARGRIPQYYERALIKNDCSLDLAQQQCRNFWYDPYLSHKQPFSIQTFSKIPLGTLDFMHTPSICFPKPNEAKSYVANFGRLLMAPKIEFSQNPDSLKCCI